MCVSLSNRIRTSSGPVSRCSVVNPGCGMADTKLTIPVTELIVTTPPIMVWLDVVNCGCVVVVVVCGGLVVVVEVVEVVVDVGGLVVVVVVEVADAPVGRESVVDGIVEVAVVDVGAGAVASSSPISVTTGSSRSNLTTSGVLVGGVVVAVVGIATAGSITRLRTWATALHENASAINTANSQPTASRRKLMRAQCQFQG